MLKTSEGSPEENAKRKNFALYNFEVLSEYHLSQELIVENSEQFLQIFMDCLSDSDSSVKVAALKSISAFLSSIDDEAVVLKYKGVMNVLLDVVIAVMQ